VTVAIPGSEVGKLRGSADSRVSEEVTAGVGSFVLGSLRAGVDRGELSAGEARGDE
jgi:hypothetical protein